MAEEVKPEIAFADFEKLDIRIGTIEKAEVVLASAKLVRLEIDFGAFKRVVFAGIKEWFSPSDLVGKQIPVVVNLAPRKMMNEFSQGMILAADDEGRAGLLLPQKPLKNGERVH